MPDLYVRLLENNDVNWKNMWLIILKLNGCFGITKLIVVEITIDVVNNSILLASQCQRFGDILPLNKVILNISVQNHKKPWSFKN